MHLSSTPRSTALAVLAACSLACGIPAKAPPDAGNPEPDAGDNTLDADGFLWGTEATGTSTATAEAIDGVLATHVVKLRLFAKSCSPAPGTFTTQCALPTLANPRAPFDLDQTVQYFEDHGWSMLPMLSYSYDEPPLRSQADAQDYAAFVAWFVARYADQAKIEWVELMNSPNMDPALLLEASNRAYDAVKAVRPQVRVGTPGFEYWDDPAVSPNMVATAEYFLEPSHGAKFDFWAFHGYHLSQFAPGNIIHFPPNTKPRFNQYAGVWGITAVRRRLDANGWEGRPILDTEHVGIIKPGSPLTPEADQLDAAYLAQELLLKKTLRLDGAPVLAGAVPLKIAPRSALGEFANANLHPDGSASQTVEAVGLLWSMLNRHRFAEHLSGAYDDDAQVWVERFEAEGRELYVFFRPFTFHADQSIALSGAATAYTLTLPRPPASVALTDLRGQRASLPLDLTVSLSATEAPAFLEVTY